MTNRCTYTTQYTKGIAEGMRLMAELIVKACHAGECAGEPRGFYQFEIMKKLMELKHGENK